MDAIGPVRRLARHAHRAGAQTLDQMQATRPVQAGEAQHGGGHGLRGQPLLRLQQQRAVETRWRGRRGLVHPVAVVFAIHRAGGHQQHLPERAPVQRFQQKAQAVHEQRAVGRLVARLRRGQVDQPRDAGGQASQGVRRGEIGAQPAQARRTPRRRPAAQRPHLVALREQTRGHAQTQIAATGQQDSFSHPNTCKSLFAISA